jgi:hypothetical protein
MDLVRSAPRKDFAQGSIEVAAGYVGHRQSGDYPPLALLAIEARHLNPRNETDASIRDFERAACDEKAGTRDRFGQRGFLFFGPINHEAVP